MIIECIGDGCWFTSEMVYQFLKMRKRRKKLYTTNGASPMCPEHLARRLANGLDAATDGACWEWVLTTNGRGYGTLTVGGRSVLAHRLAYRLSKGQIPPGKDVMHECDNPRCINPDHLAVGSRSKNMKDCYLRGRSKMPVVHMRGESNGCAKLNRSQVNEIRNMIAAGQVSQARIARMFGVSTSTVSLIKLNRVWGHEYP